MVLDNDKNLEFLVIRL